MDYFNFSNSPFVIPKGTILELTETKEQVELMNDLIIAEEYPEERVAINKYNNGNYIGTDYISNKYAFANLLYEDNYLYKTDLIFSLTQEKNNLFVIETYSEKIYFSILSEQLLFTLNTLKQIYK